MQAEETLYRSGVRPVHVKVTWWLGAFVAALAVFLFLGAYQLDLPGLQYDEAKEAGVNAMQLAMGQPVTAFRDAVVPIGPWRIPLMVQDYIGALNAILAIPFLAIGGVNVVALRWLPLMVGAGTLWLAWRLALRLGGPAAATATVVLLALNPTFLFWSRQGIFVTNLTAFFFLASLLAGLHWWQEQRPRHLWLMALCWGLGLYAKLLFVWAIGAMVGLAVIVWALGRVRRSGPTWKESGCQAPPAWTWWVAGLLFVLPLVPLILFNLQTSGTLASVLGNLGRSYYGVDNRAYWPNLITRLGQLRILLLGDHLWYLGEVYANNLAPWLAAGLTLVALAVRIARSRPGGTAWLIPLALLALAVIQSAFTVSDLFVTHYAMLLPLLPLTGGLAVAVLWQAGRDANAAAGRVLMPALACLGLLLWAGSDGYNTIRYHRILAISGGYGSHSDAVYRLADYLVQREPAAPLALDWGVDAQLRFLTGGRVNAVEVFGYNSLDQPDPGFAGRIAPFLDNPHTLYIAHVPDETVFRGRVEALERLAAEHGLALREEARFRLRSGRSLFILYRVDRPDQVSSRLISTRLVSIDGQVERTGHSVLGGG